MSFADFLFFFVLNHPFLYLFSASFFVYSLISFIRYADSWGARLAPTNDKLKITAAEGPRKKVIYFEESGRVCLNATPYAALLGVKSEDLESFSDAELNQWIEEVNYAAQWEQFPDHEEIFKISSQPKVVGTKLEDS